MAAAGVDTAHVAYVHHCVFCGWRRRAASPTMLSPRCEACGCMLVATPEQEYELSVRAPAAPPHAAHQLLSPSLVRGARRLLLLAILLAAAKAGHAEGGPALGLAAFGLVGLLGVPLAVDD